MWARLAAAGHLHGFPGSASTTPPEKHVPPHLNAKYYVLL